MPVSKKAAPAEPDLPVRLNDARPDRLDVRDLPYRAPLRSLPPVHPLERDIGRFIGDYVAQGLVLDQGDQGACTGFGLACVANYLLWMRHVESGVKRRFAPVSQRMFYELAKRYDEWPGTDYDGSSCRGAIKGWHKHGVCRAKDWPYELDADGVAVFARPRPGWETDAATRPLGIYYRIDKASVVDLQAAIVDIGAIYVSADAHDGWDALTRKRARKPPARHADLPAIGPITDRRSAGGHAFALVGYNDRGFVVQNSWGEAWGASGFAVLPYDEWVQNGSDAWACGLGVPTSVLDPRTRAAVPMAASSWRVGSGQSLTVVGTSTRAPDNPPSDPWPIDHKFDCAAYQPWSTPDAYAHALVTGSDGQLSVTDFTRSAVDQAGLAEEIVRTRPATWFATTGAEVLKLAIYAHGGLNKEQDSIQRIRVMGPCFEANGVYPLFLTWKTGVGDTLADMAQDWARKTLGVDGVDGSILGALLDALGDAKDRAIEALGHVLGKGIWTEMRDNAKGGAAPGHGLALLLANLVALATDLAASGKKLEVHLVGHSAGSILLGHFVSLLARAPGALPFAVPSTALYAAACSSAFANAHYTAAALAGRFDLKTLWLYVLSDDNEQADGLPSPSMPAYGKSLLYLVSRALDDVRKQPLLGMERALTPDHVDDRQWDDAQLDEVRRWQAAWPGTEANGLLTIVRTPQVITTRMDDRIAATHGSFDNNIPVLGETIERISGRALVAPLEWFDY